MIHLLTQFVFSQSHNPCATSVSHISGPRVITRHPVSWDRRWNFIGFSEHDLTLTKVDMCVETIMLGALNFPWKRHQLFMLMQLALRLASSLHEPLLITTYKTVTVNFKASILSLRGWWAGHKLSWRWRRTRGKQLWKFHQSRPHTTAGPVSGRIVEEQRWVEGQTWGAARAEGGLSHPATALCHRANTHTHTGYYCSTGQRATEAIFSLSYSINLLKACFVVKTSSFHQLEWTCVCLCRRSLPALVLTLCHIIL